MKSGFVLAGVLVTFCVGPALGVATYDLSGGGSVNINGATWSTTDPHSTGTGVFEPFVRIQGNGVEEGYNTGSDVLWGQTKGSGWTHPLSLTDLQADVAGYFMFVLDADQNAGPGSKLNITSLIISLQEGPDLTGDPSGFTGDVVYDLDGAGDSTVTIDYNLQGVGSGTGDLSVLIDADEFLGHPGLSYVYLYAVMGDTQYPANDGPEEWHALTGGTPPPPPIPAPGAVLLGGIGVVVVGWMRRRKSF